MAYRRLKFRDPVRHYFRALLVATSIGAKAPPIPHTPDAGVNCRIRAATLTILKCHSDQPLEMNSPSRVLGRETRTDE